MRRRRHLFKWVSVSFNCSSWKWGDEDEEARVPLGGINIMITIHWIWVFWSDGARGSMKMKMSVACRAKRESRSISKLMAKVNHSLKHTQSQRSQSKWSIATFLFSSRSDWIVVFLEKWVAQEMVHSFISNSFSLRLKGRAVNHHHHLESHTHTHTWLWYIMGDYITTVITFCPLNKWDTLIIHSRTQNHIETRPVSFSFFSHSLDPDMESLSRHSLTSRTENKKLESQRR